MTTSTRPAPRVLLADGDAGRRAALRAALADEFHVAESGSAEDALLFLQDREPGLTLVDHGLPGAAGAEIVSRIRELHPQELVLILAADPSLGLCRAAMRAGAYDCLDRGVLLPEQLRGVCDVAARRLDEAERERRLAEDLARAAVRRHEQEAAARVARPAAQKAWAGVDPGLRRRWVDAYLAAASQRSDDVDRDRAVRELVDEVAVEARPADLWLALHVHAAASGRAREGSDALERAREVLVSGLLALLDRARGGGPRPPG